MRDLNRITFDPEVMQGQACIRGMRIPVSLVVNLLSNGRSEDQIISDFPDLELEDIRQSLKYAVRLTRESETDKGEIINPLDGHIAITPGVVSGEPRIAGRRIKVRHIVVWHERMGMTLDEIADEYELELADIHAALAYYFIHREAIDQDIRDYDSFNDALEKASSYEEKQKLLTSWEWPERYGSTQTSMSQGP
jgi:uncharacterized protein (DUF433 family)